MSVCTEFRLVWTFMEQGRRFPSKNGQNETSAGKLDHIRNVENIQKIWKSFPIHSWYSGDKPGHALSGGMKKNLDCI